MHLRTLKRTKIAIQLHYTSFPTTINKKLYSELSLSTLQLLAQIEPTIKSTTPTKLIREDIVLKKVKRVIYYDSN